MVLRTLKKGSKTKINLGYCCANPWSFESWAEGEDGAYLQRRPHKKNPARASRGRG